MTPRQIIDSLVSMGFTEAHATKACEATNAINSEIACAWLIDHADDPTLDVPYEETGEGGQMPRSQSRDSFVFVNDDFKMVILVRSDLEMSAGKIAAQCSHAVLGAYRKMMDSAPGLLQNWELTGEAVIVLKVDSQDQMQELAAKAETRGICWYIVTDAGRTQVESGTQTVCAIGPALVSDVDVITSSLSLL